MYEIKKKVTKANAITVAASVIVGFGLGATIDDIGAKDIDRRVTVQKIVTSETEGLIRSVVAAEACPEIYESHGADCNISKDMRRVCFDPFKDGDEYSMRMFAGFRLPGTFKAE